MKIRYKPGTNCCPGCLIFGDNFDRADEDIDGVDSTGKWICAPDNRWQIAATGGDLKASGGFTAGVSATWTGSPPRNFSVGVDFHLGTGKVFQFWYQALSESGGNRYCVEIEAGNEDVGSCGVLRLLDITNLGSPQQLGWDVPVPNLTATQWHRVTLCYDADTQILSTHVKTVDGKIYSHHAFEQATPPDPLTESDIRIVIPSLDSVYIFDNFRVDETLDRGGYYGYGDNNCPCCGPRDCQTILAEFPNCQWEVASGSWSGTDGISTSSTDARINWLGSWSGITEECRPDKTASESAEFDTTYGATIRLYMGDVWAQFTAESFEDAGDATLELSTGATVSGGLGKSGTLRICVMPTIIAAICNGLYVHSHNSGGEPGNAAVEVLGATGTTTFSSISISHNLETPSCPDCWSGEGAPGGPCQWNISTASCLDVFSDVTPQWIIVSSTGVNNIDPNANGTSLGRSWIMMNDSNDPCTWTLFDLKFCEDEACDESGTFGGFTWRVLDDPNCPPNALHSCYEEVWGWCEFINGVVGGGGGGYSTTGFPFPLSPFESLILESRSEEEVFDGLPIHATRWTFHPLSITLLPDGTTSFSAAVLLWAFDLESNESVTVATLGLSTGVITWGGVIGNWSEIDGIACEMLSGVITGGVSTNACVPNDLIDFDNASFEFHS